MTNQNILQVKSIIRSDKCSIYLSKLSFKGLKDMHKYSKVKKFYKFLSLPIPKKLSETKKYLIELMSRTKYGFEGGYSRYWFIKNKKNQVIGTIGICSCDFLRSNAVMGKGIAVEFQGSSAIYESIYLLANFCFIELKIKTLYTVTSKKNLNNIKLMKFLGSKIVKKINSNCSIPKNSVLLELDLNKKNINKMLKLIKFTNFLCKA